MLGCPMNDFIGHPNIGHFGNRPAPSVNDNHTRAGDIVIQVPGSLVLQGYRIVDFNLETGTVEVELLAVAGHAEAESRPARDFGGLSDVICPQVEGPELTPFVAEYALRDNGISVLFVGCDLKSRHAVRSRVDGSEVHLTGGQIETGDAEHAAVYDRVG